MDEREFQQKLADLIDQIDRLPDEQRGRLHKLAEETKTRHEKIRQTVKGLQDSLDHLRLSVKYLVFDLEATRRENQYLRNMIAQQDSPPGEGAD